MANGKIAKCSFYEENAAGTVDEGLVAVWSKIPPILLKDLSCRCDFLEICRGGCRFRAELLEGKGGKDPYRCILYGILEK
jgi:radical SAM protein with 4Fe4S-binding SPASM domain